MGFKSKILPLLTIGYLIVILSPVVLGQTKNTTLKKVRTCESLTNEIIPKKQLIQKKLEESKQITSNVLFSLNSQVQILDKNNKKYNLINKNLDKYNNDLDYFLIERENLIFKLEELQKIDCLTSKPQYLAKIKSFNQLYKSNQKRNNDLKRYLKLNIIDEINAISKGDKVEN
ncbi:MAG: hypothetical protein EBV07_01175 [Proteobacteria bacterium]|nr:hypothetical protein [Pseudomonadota bacterium]